MESQDDYVRSQLRVPRELHEKLTEAARIARRSLNAEVNARLVESFERRDAQNLEDIDARLDRNFAKLIEAVKGLSPEAAAAITKALEPNPASKRRRQSTSRGG
jgi:hypothetical protein